MGLFLLAEVKKGYWVIVYAELKEFGNAVSEIVNADHYELYDEG